MTFLDDATDLLNHGFDTARSAVSGAAMEQLGFVREFVRLCDDGWHQGWHECNGGNLSYRLTDEEVPAAQRLFDAQPREWRTLGAEAPNLGGAFLLVTAAGCHFRSISRNVKKSVGIVEVNTTGDAFRIVWGLADGGLPTSELPAHVMAHSVRMAATGGECRVIYHAHPSNIAAMTSIVPLESAAFSRVLWKALTESVVVFPEGIGVIPWYVPGSREMAEATSFAMEDHGAVIWPHHGVLASGAGFDSAFGLLHTIEKAAGIYGCAQSMNGGSSEFPNAISNGQLQRLASELGLPLRLSYLG